MNALIVISREPNGKLDEFFNSYDVIKLSTAPDSLYDEANKVVELAKAYETVIVIVDSPILTAIVAAKLARVREFLLAEWTGSRYRVLRVP